MEVKRSVTQTVRFPLETLCWAQLAEERMCHGARGIAVSLTRKYQSDCLGEAGEEEPRKEAES